MCRSPFLTLNFLSFSLFLISRLLLYIFSSCFPFSVVSFIPFFSLIYMTLPHLHLDNVCVGVRVIYTILRSISRSTCDGGKSWRRFLVLRTPMFFLAMFIVLWYVRTHSMCIRTYMCCVGVFLIPVLLIPFYFRSTSILHYHILPYHISSHGMSSRRVTLTIQYNIDINKIHRTTPHHTSPDHIQRITR
jgi:hypothetical protein